MSNVRKEWEIDWKSDDWKYEKKYNINNNHYYFSIVKSSNPNYYIKIKCFAKYFKENHTLVFDVYCSLDKSQVVNSKMQFSSQRKENIVFIPIHPKKEKFTITFSNINIIDIIPQSKPKVKDPINNNITQKNQITSQNVAKMNLITSPQKTFYNTPSSKDQQTTTVKTPSPIVKRQSQDNYNNQKTKTVQNQSSYHSLSIQKPNLTSTPIPKQQQQQQQQNIVYNLYNTTGNQTIPSNNNMNIIKKSSPKYCGLINQGVTCYMNSSLQSLFHIPLFRNMILRLESKRKPAILGLQMLFYSMSVYDKQIYTNSFTKSLGWDENRLSRQQDVPEFIDMLLNYIKINQTDCNIDQLFFYTIQNENFTSIFFTVNMDNNNLQSDIDTYLEKSQFSYLPKILFVQLIRFDYIKNVKNQKEYKFSNNITVQSCEYELYGIILHRGSSIISGHYICYLKTSGSNWYSFNDSTVTEIDSNKVFTDDTYKNAYVLIYTKRECHSEIFCKPIQERPTVHLHIYSEDVMKLLCFYGCSSFSYNNLPKTEIDVPIDTKYDDITPILANKFHIDNCNRIRLWSISDNGSISNLILKESTIDEEFHNRFFLLENGSEFKQETISIVFIKVFSSSTTDPYRNREREPFLLYTGTAQFSIVTYEYLETYGNELLRGMVLDQKNANSLEIFIEQTDDINTSYIPLSPDFQLNIPSGTTIVYSIGSQLNSRETLKYLPSREIVMQNKDKFPDFAELVGDLSTDYYAYSSLRNNFYDVTLKLIEPIDKPKEDNMETMQIKIPKYQVSLNIINEYILKKLNKQQPIKLFTQAQSLIGPSKTPVNDEIELGDALREPSPVLYVLDAALFPENHHLIQICYDSIPNKEFKTEYLIVKEDFSTFEEIRNHPMLRDRLKNNYIISIVDNKEFTNDFKYYDYILIETSDFNNMKEVIMDTDNAKYPRLDFPFHIDIEGNDVEKITASIASYFKKAKTQVHLFTDISKTEQLTNNNLENSEMICFSLDDDIDQNLKQDLSIRTVFE